MMIKYYFNNYTTKTISFIIFLNLLVFYNFTNLYATDNEKDLETINLGEKNERIPRDLQSYIPPDKLDKEIFLSLERLLNKDGFDNMNGRLWLLKAMLYAATPFSCGANTLIIAKTSAVTAKLVLAAQFTVPRTIENICFLVDKARLAVKEKRLLMSTWSEEELEKDGDKLSRTGILKQKLTGWCKEIPDNKQRLVKIAWSTIRLAVGLYLAYSYSLIDAETAGDAYRWIYEGATDNETLLDNAERVGYFLNFCYTALLGAIFFYQLIDEILMRSSIGYLLGICPPANKDLEYEEYMGHITKLRTLCYSPPKEEKNSELLDAIVEEYMSDRNINSTYNVASLQNCLAAKEKPKSKCTNIGINIFKLIFVTGATVLCGVSFKYIFASGTILRNYVEAVGDEVTKDNYIFQLKNGGNFSCTSVSDCTENVDFDTVLISDSQKDKLLDLNKTADLANILQGVAISADTAVLILSAITVGYSLITSKLHRRAFRHGLLKKSQIWPAAGAALILPAMVFYLDNVNNVRPIAKTANKLLESTGQDTFLPVDLGVAATIGVLGATFALGARLLSNLPNAIVATPKKLRCL